MGGQQERAVWAGCAGGDLGDGLDAFDVVVMADSAVAVGRTLLRRARFNHDCARTQLQLFHVLLHAGHHAHDVFIGRIFSGDTIAAAAASDIFCAAAVTCRGHRQTFNEWVSAARSDFAPDGHAGLYRIRILCVAGFVPAAVVSVRGCYAMG